MAISFSKKEKDKKRRKKNRDKQLRREQKKLSNSKPPEFMFVDENGNLTTERPDESQKAEVAIEDIDVSTPKGEKPAGSRFEKTGFVKFLNLDKGYGFITDNNSQISYFVHIDELGTSAREGSKVTFEAGKGPKGPVAMSVRVH
ncbi:cold-shock protein [Lewinella sp. IMCC34183]|uniref:cold-shock protein n=1 Tax=Lewinella sp. IMCC34183 TaxID=2248762 RepID=UPI000E24FFC4|nr:cold shock domain-containing protein [Lewinella sp. IMCC34183]